MSTELQTLDLASLSVGALFTMFVAFVAARHQFKNELCKESAAHKRQLLEKIAMEMAAYITAPTDYVHALAVYRFSSGLEIGRDDDAFATRSDAARPVCVSEFYAGWREVTRPEVAAVRNALDSLGHAHQQLARAIYWASLTSDAGLAGALDNYWYTANGAYLAFRRRFTAIGDDAANKWMAQLSERSEAVRRELGRAFRNSCRA